MKKISTYVKISLRKLKDGDYMTVADRIRLKREELNISQEELAIKIGNKDKSTISKIEKAGDNITMKNIKRIAEALGVSTQYLLGWEETSKSLRVEILKNEYEYAQAKMDGNKELMKDLEEKGDYLSEKYRKRYEDYLSTKYFEKEPSFEKDEDKETFEALELYKLYEKAEPNVRAAIDALLKSAQ